MVLEIKWSSDFITYFTHQNTIYHVAITYLYDIKSTSVSSMLQSNVHVEDSPVHQEEVEANLVTSKSAAAKRKRII